MLRIIISLPDNNSLKKERDHLYTHHNAVSCMSLYDYNSSRVLFIQYVVYATINHKYPDTAF